jgi:hypothetical protein
VIIFSFLSIDTGRVGAANRADFNDMKNLLYIEQNSKQYADKVIYSI